MSSSRTLIIDADSLAFTIAYFNQKAIAEQPEAIEGDFEGFDGEEPIAGAWAIDAINEQLSKWMTVNKCDDYEFHLTAGGRLAPVFEDIMGRPPEANFRYQVADQLAHGYKHNRVSDPIPGTEEVLEVMARGFNSVLHDKWEADDAVVALKREFPDNIMLAAIDKDVLNQTEGIHFDYRKGEPHVTTKENSIRYAYWQCLVGDPGDGYKGVPGVGKVKAEKLLTPGMTELQMWKTVLSQFKLTGLTELDALATMQLANMNQLVLAFAEPLVASPVKNWNDIANIELWTPPT